MSFARQSKSGTLQQTTIETMKKTKSALLFALPAVLMLLTGCSRTIPDCADQVVKDTLTERILTSLADSGIPDLVARVKEGRVKVTLDTISEIERNKESKVVQCAGNLTVQFPAEDIDRARSSESAAMATAINSNFSLPEKSSLVAAIKYEASAPADKKEAKDGPIVEIMSGGPQPLDELTGYASAYTMLAFSTPDLNSNSRNTKPWDREVHDKYVESCMKQSGKTTEQCGCKAREIEKMLPQENLMRIGFAIQTSPLVVNKFPNFVRVSQSLDTECPSATSTVAGHEAAPPSGVGVGAVPDAEDHTSNSFSETNQTKESAGTSTATSKATSSAGASIEASFDCAKAQTRTEKLICSNPQAAAADKRLAAAYSIARRSANDVAGLKAGQMEWIKSVRDKCADVQCVTSAMNDRAARLETQ